MSRRLTLVVPSLTYGGAERVVARMANHWATAGNSVTVITLSSAASDTYRLDDSVQRIALDLLRDSQGFERVSNNLRRVGRLRDAIKRANPDTVVSFTDRMNVVTLLACRPLKVDTVIAERSNPARNERSPLWSWLARRIRRWARAAVVQTETARRHLAPSMRDRPIYVIPNFVDRPAVRPHTLQQMDAGPSGRRIVVGMGRLSFEKGFDRLIEAFARVAAAHSDWGLTILGEGPERPALEQLIAAHGLTGRVSLPGWEPNTAGVLGRCHLFVLPSRFEGFPNGLLEAMACGLPCISLDCESGPAEIIRPGIDGVLVRADDMPALADAMDRLMQDPSLRERLGRAAGEVVERFSAARYYEQWEDVLSAAGAEHK